MYVCAQNEAKVKEPAVTIVTIWQESKEERKRGREKGLNAAASSEC